MTRPLVDLRPTLHDGYDWAHPYGSRTLHIVAAGATETRCGVKLNTIDQRRHTLTTRWLRWRGCLACMAPDAQEGATSGRTPERVY